MQVPSLVLQSSRSARFAAIDLGSNAIRLEIVEADEVFSPPVSAGGGGHRWSRILYERVPVRLGGDVFAHGRVRRATMVAACDTFAQFRRAMDLALVRAYRAVATSAVREAENRADLVSEIERTTGIPLEVISGEQEAELISVAVRSRVPMEEGIVLLIDIGGGSAEISVLREGTVRQAWSLPLGTVRLLEMQRSSTTGLSPQEVRELEQRIDEVLGPVLASIASLDGPVDRVVATGGNAKALARMCPVAGHLECIDVERMRMLLCELAPMSPRARSTAYGFAADRADVIVPACAVLGRFATHLGVSTLHAPEVGLKDGILVQLIETARHGITAGARAAGMPHRNLRASAGRFQAP